MRRSRRSVLSAAALGLVLAATGCTYLSPVQTKEFYQSADGTNANIEQDGALFAGVRNALVVIADDGTPIFSASVANYTDEEITVSLEGVSETSSIFSTDVQVEPHSTAELGVGEGRTIVPIGAVDLLPGTIIDLEVAAAGQSTTISMPVMDTSLDYLELKDKAEG